MSALITRDRVLGTLQDLPSFPPMVLKILETMADPHSHLQNLVEYIEREPVVAARVLSYANRAGTTTHGGVPIPDVFTAASLVGVARVREIAVMSSLANFLQSSELVQANGLLFWRRSVAVAVCCMELAAHAPGDISLDAALIAGLLHDVGELWMLRFEPARMVQVQHSTRTNGGDRAAAEQDAMGQDHATVSAWLLQAWGLPSEIIQAASHHQTPDSLTIADEPLVAVVHVGVILSSALALAGDRSGRLGRISATACAQLDLNWGAGTHSLFGRIEARSHHAFAGLQ